MGYFRAELVERRRWLAEDQFGQLLAICQFLPGPASSQLGFCLGLLRAGWCGALAAFLGFTLPSALLLVGLATAIHGLKLVACAVVADAVLGMWRKLCPDTATRTIAILAAASLLLVGAAWAQIIVVGLAALAGTFLRSGRGNRDGGGSGDGVAIPVPYGTQTGGWLILAFAALLSGLPLLAMAGDGLPAVANAFYQAGALVFSGGHVVVPLLEDSVVATGWVTPEQFLAGYGAAQAMPGPMFALSAYLGAVMGVGSSPSGTAAVALVFMFLPGFLLAAGLLPFWHAVSHSATLAHAIAGINAAVVGLLGAALYQPVLVSGIKGPGDVAIALIAFGLLAIWRVSPLLVVVWCLLARALPLGI
nr:chromate efflux transporter [Cyanobium sp. LEGE 06143]